jgi:BirA family biotin operon repressor/biotin-[acetyl-CoA-carboxylase] ligase
LLPKFEHLLQAKAYFDGYYLQITLLRYYLVVELEKTQNLVNWLKYLPVTDSTNLELARLLMNQQLPNFSALIAGEQTGGQGRLGRTWVSEPETSLSLSLYLRSDAQISQLGFLTLIAAASLNAAIRSFDSGVESGVKWPNDVLVQGKKISGILAQIQPDGALILGVGINLKKQLGAPETAISLEELGIQASFDDVLASFLTQFRARFSMFLESPQLAIQKTRGELKTVLLTLGTRVKAQLPGGAEIIGQAVGIDELGSLVIQRNEGDLVSVSAADIWHLRN